ncbi:MAG TPA: ECF-type sigma factor [Caldimonas sp.]|jgi:RNA polymerase sigma factor (TIGR02999 family)|nr:ECF-type sigma factor [Caldimonas sp.]HEX4233981.1 ECF-type sigma factor [Caldimonas sp.]
MAEEPLTVTLRAAHAGDRGAADRAYAALYPELLKIARARLRVHQPNTLLDTAGLVHESFLRFVSADKLGIADRKHFFAYAAKTMRNIVIDFARRRQAVRHGGAAERVTLDSRLLGEGAQEASVIDVDKILRELEALDPTLAQVVEMRYFGGFTDAEIAAAMDVSDRTVRRHWDKARAFMLVQLEP